MGGHGVKMASIIDDGAESLLEAQRTSLLDIIEDRNRTLNKKSLLHRMVVISKMYHQNFTEIGQWYEKFFKGVQNQYQCEGVTGLLLLYPRHCVHVVESCLEVLIELLRHVQHEADTGTGNMEASKILIVSHDIPHRQYNQWSFRILDIEAPQIEDYETSEESDALVTDMLTQLLKLGAYISKQPKVSLKNAMDSLHDKVPEFLPQQDVIGYLLENEEQCITTPLQYLSKYDQPYDVVLASDLVWPLPTRVFPYN